MVEMTNQEFHDAWCSLSWNSNKGDEDYWKHKRDKEEHHPLVGRKAIITVPKSTIVNRLLTVIRANDVVTIFDLGNGGELIVSDRDIENGYQIKWVE